MAMKRIAKRSNITVKSRLFETKTFKNKNKAKDWIMRGMCSCEGAERERYISMLFQLNIGDTELDYDRT